MYPFRIYSLFANFIFLLNTLCSKSKQPMPSGQQEASQRGHQKIEVIPEEVKPNHSYAANADYCRQMQRHPQKKWTFGLGMHEVAKMENILLGGL